MKELIKVVSKKMFILAFIVSVIYSVADYSEAFILAHFGTSPLTLEKIVSLTIGIILIDIIILIVVKVGSYVDNINNIKQQTAIQKYYFNKIQDMSMEQIANTHTGYIHKLITNVSFYFSELTYQIGISVIPLLIGGVSIFIMLCTQSFITGIVCIIISIVAVIIKVRMLKDKQKYQKIVNEADSKYNATFIDFIQNIITVRKLNLRKFCSEKISENSDEYLNATKVNERKRSMTNGVFTGLMNLLYVVVLLSTIAIVANGEDGLPYLLFYMSALAKLTLNLNSLVRCIDIKEKFNTAKKQLDEYFKDNKEIKTIQKFQTVRIVDTVFSYTEGSTKIKIPEFIMKKGDKISIMGESGQGKTTVMNLLAGLYPVKEGKVLINNKIKENIKLDLVFVSQEVDLFNLSIRDNLCLGKDILDEKIIELFEEAGLINWYKELPEGLDTIVGEKGIKLSAGQKQRLNLIRGILTDKEVYFFDEPTSNLDSLSEEKISYMIEKYLKEKTYIIVTHRPKLKQLCDRHYIFENHMMKEVIGYR